MGEEAWTTTFANLAAEYGEERVRTAAMEAVAKVTTSMRLHWRTQIPETWCVVRIVLGSWDPFLLQEVSRWL